MQDTATQAPHRTPDAAPLLQRFNGAEAFGSVLISAFDQVDEPSLLLDPYGGQVLRGNAAAQRFFRLPGGSLKGVYIDKLYPQHRSELYVFTEEAIDTGSARTRALKVLRPDGGVIAIEHHALRVQVDKNTLILIRLLDLDALYGRDVSEAAESYLRKGLHACCLLYTSPSPRDRTRSRMPSSA